MTATPSTPDTPTTAADAFEAWIGAAWTQHADDSAGLAPRLVAEGPALVHDEDALVRLGHLTQHVFGEHLARWADGRAQLAALGAHRMAGDTFRGRAATWDAALALAAGGGSTDPRAGRSDSERVRITAIAAGHLVTHDPARATTLLADAQAEEESLGLKDDDPAIRALAVTTNNLAAELSEKPARDAAATALMLRAAAAARRHWARAGTWLETERAEWRLAGCHLAAGDLPQARRHAQACLEIVRAHDSPPLEAFFGWEVLGRIERAGGNPAGHAEALARARAAFEALPDSDRGWCRPTLETLERAA